MHATLIFPPLFLFWKTMQAQNLRMSHNLLLFACLPRAENHSSTATHRQKIMFLFWANVNFTTLRRACKLFVVKYTRGFSAGRENVGEYSRFLKTGLPFCGSGTLVGQMNSEIRFCHSVYWKMHATFCTRSVSWIS